MPTSVPEGLRAIVKKALQKNRENRFQTAREMHEALKNPQQFLAEENRNKKDSETIVDEDFDKAKNLVSSTNKNNIPTNLPSPSNLFTHPVYQQQQPPIIPFDEPKLPAKKYPFEPVSSFRQVETSSESFPQPELIPSSKFGTKWQNQAITPFQPRGVGRRQNQTLAIISLAIGILSFFCCSWFLPGLIAVVLGFLAMNKADRNPIEYGGQWIALSGVITGGISLILGIIYTVLIMEGKL